MTKTKSARNATTVDNLVGSRLKRLRLKVDITQAELSKRVNVSYQQIQKYESGANRISVSRLWEFCEVFGVLPNYFYLNLLDEQAYDLGEKELGYLETLMIGRVADRSATEIFSRPE